MMKPCLDENKVLLIGSSAKRLQLSSNNKGQDLTGITYDLKGLK